jgi:hypothetical protein
MRVTFSRFVGPATLPPARRRLRPVCLADVAGARACKLASACAPALLDACGLPRSGEEFGAWRIGIHIAPAGIARQFREVSSVAKIVVTTTSGPRSCDPAILQQRDLHRVASWTDDIHWHWHRFAGRGRHADMIGPTERLLRAAALLAVRAPRAPSSAEPAPPLLPLAPSPTHACRRCWRRPASRKGPARLGRARRSSTASGACAGGSAGPARAARHCARATCNHHTPPAAQLPEPAPAIRDPPTPPQTQAPPAPAPTPRLQVRALLPLRREDPLRGALVQEPPRLPPLQRLRGRHGQGNEGLVSARIEGPASPRAAAARLVGCMQDPAGPTPPAGPAAASQQAQQGGCMCPGSASLAAAATKRPCLPLLAAAPPAQAAVQRRLLALLHRGRRRPLRLPHQGA